jgi:CDP-glucose 4,6-dehydratase
VVVTSDKVYRNDNSGRPFREDDALGGSDPYSASKAACERLVQAMREPPSAAMPVLVTVRAGNVIGGGDFGEERLVPDLQRAELAGHALQVRRPEATRPFQHVLDVLVGYLLVAEQAVCAPRDVPAALNFGPDGGAMSVRALLEGYGAARGRAVDWVHTGEDTYYEAGRLGVDATLARSRLGWAPRHDAASMLAATARWYEAWRRDEDLRARSRDDVREALGLTRLATEAAPLAARIEAGLAAPRPRFVPTAARTPPALAAAG